MSYRDTLIREQRSSRHDEIVIGLDDHRAEVLSALGIEQEPRRVVWEMPLLAGDLHTTVAGFLDLVYCFGDEHQEWLRVAFEVKPEIECLGDVIRQIRFYEAKAPSHPYGTVMSKVTWWWVVVSPDDRHADRLRAQGIKFLHWKPSA